MPDQRTTGPDVRKTMTQTLDFLRRQAKTLKRAFAADDPDARARATAALGSVAKLRHTTALHVIAREEGYDSWPS